MAHPISAALQTIGTITEDERKLCITLGKRLAQTALKLSD